MADTGSDKGNCICHFAYVSSDANTVFALYTVCN